MSCLQVLVCTRTEPARLSTPIPHAQLSCQTAPRVATVMESFNMFLTSALSLGSPRTVWREDESLDEWLFTMQTNGDLAELGLTLQSTTYDTL